MSDSNKIQGFKDLACWKAGREVRKFVSQLVRTFPSDEKFALVTQMRNASRSITHNIAEGYGRYGFKDNAKFCRISRGSTYEVLDQIITAFDEGYISQEQLDEGTELITKTIRITNGYINYLVNASNKVNEPNAGYGLSYGVSINC